MTGASGFVGKAICETLIEHGWQVRVLARDPTQIGEKKPGLKIVPGSLENLASLGRLLDGASAVVHAAGAIKARSSKEFHETNASGTARLVAEAATAKSRPRVLLISSLAAREPSLSPYAASKRAAEEAVSRHGRGLRHCVVRPPAIYGPGDRSTLSLFRQLAKGYAIVPWQERARFSLLYIDDLVSLVLRLLAASKWDGSIMEPDDRREGGYAWKELAELASEYLDRPVRCLTVPYRAIWVPAAVNEAVSSMLGRAPMLTKAKLRELFHPDWVCNPAQPEMFPDWQPTIGFKEGFERTLLWYKRENWL